MERGNIGEFVRAHPGINRLELVRSSFGSFSSLGIDVRMVAEAYGCRRGAGLYA